jgi:hypothetical protein
MVFGFGGSAMVGVVGGAIPLFLNILDFLLALERNSPVNDSI